MKSSKKWSISYEKPKVTSEHFMLQPSGFKISGNKKKHRMSQPMIHEDDWIYNGLQDIFINALNKGVQKISIAINCTISVLRWHDFGRLSFGIVI